MSNPRESEFHIVNEGPAPVEAIGVPYTILEHPDQYETQLPYWGRTTSFIRSYEASRPKGKDALVRDLGQAVAHNPSMLRAVVTNLDLVGQLMFPEAMPHIQSGFVRQAEQAAAYRPNLGKWTPDKIEDLVRLSLDIRGRGQEIVQRIEAAVFNASQTPEEAIDIHYSAAWAMATTTQPDVREELYSILCYEKDWFNPDSFPAFLFNVAGVNLADDTHLERHSAILGALNVVGSMLEMEDGNMPVEPSRPQAVFPYLASVYSRLSTEEQVKREKAVTRGIQANRTRYEALQRYTLGRAGEILARRTSVNDITQDMTGKSFKDKLEEMIQEKERLRSLPWPASAIKNPDEPLNVIVDQIASPMTFRAGWEDAVAYKLAQGFVRVTPRPIQVASDINLDIIAEGYDSPESRQFVARRVYEALTTGGTIQPSHEYPPQSTDGLLDVIRILPGGSVSSFDPEGKIKFALYRRFSEEELGNLASIIEFHRPVISYEQYKDIENRIADLRQEITTRFTKSVGTRGYELLIADPALRELGYTSLSFQQVDDVIKAGVVIDGQNYDFYLDSSEFRTLFQGDIKRFQTPQDQAWIELLALSHLRKIMCVSDDDIKQELVGGEKQERIYKKQTVARSEHLRWQAPGRIKGFSQEAFLRCLQSGLPEKNLYKINQDRATMGWGGTVETGIWTYVKGVEKTEEDNDKPIKVAFTKASDDIRAVVNLGEVSEEELALLEQDILAGLEGLDLA